MRKTNTIVIEDWTGRILYKGNYKNKEVDKVLDANRCSTCVDSPVCKECGGTGYSGDIEVRWHNEYGHEDDNVYEFINY